MRNNLKNNIQAKLHYNCIHVYSRTTISAGLDCQILSVATKTETQSQFHYNTLQIITNS